MIPFSFWKPSGYADIVGSLNFVGGQTMVGVNNPALDFDYGTPFTIAMWVYRGSSANDRFIIGKIADSTSAGWYIHQRNESARRYGLVFRDSAGGKSEVFIALTTLLSEWNMVIFSYNGGDPNSATSYRGWMNGFEQTMTQSTGTFNLALSALNSSTVKVGNLAGFTGFFGRIGPIAIYNQDIFGAVDQYEDYKISRTFVGAALGKRFRTAVFDYISSYGYDPVAMYPNDTNTLVGSDYIYPNEIDSNYPLTNPADLLITDVPVLFNNSLSPHMEEADSPIRLKNFSTYTLISDSFSDIVSKTTNDGSYVGSAQSTQKLVGDGKIILGWRSQSSTLQHMYLSLTDEANAITNPIQATFLNRVTFGIGNNALLVYTGNTSVYSTAIPSVGDIVYAIVSGDDILIYRNTTLKYTVTGGALMFPNGIYVAPITLYTYGIASNYKVLGESWWSFEGGLTGSLADNDLI